MTPRSRSFVDSLGLHRRFGAKLTAMNTPIPQGLSEAIRARVLPLRDELVRAGWQFGTIQWDKERERKLAFTVRAPSGNMRYIACGEDALVDKLEQLLGSN